MEINAPGQESQIVASEGRAVTNAGKAVAVPQSSQRSQTWTWSACGRGAEKSRRARHEGHIPERGKRRSATPRTISRFPIPRYLDIMARMYDLSGLALVVWPRQSETGVSSGDVTWAEAARGAWAMDSAKAAAVELLLAVGRDDRIVGAWRVVGVEHASATPPGKSRVVNRSSFDLVEDPELNQLVGMPSPVPRRRNPQTTLPLAEIPGLAVQESGGKRHGSARVGAYRLTVYADGRAEVVVPVDGVLTVRVEPA